MDDSWDQIQGKRPKPSDLQDYDRTKFEEYAEALRLIRKHQKHPKDPPSRMFIRVAQELELAQRPRRDDLGKMLNAWKFWGDLSPDLQSELLDCIEHTYSR